MYDIFSEELADVERSLEVLEQSTMRYRSGRMQKRTGNPETEP